MNTTEQSGEKQVFGVTPDGTKLQVIGQHVCGGQVLLYDVVKVSGSEVMQVNPSDITLRGE